MQREVVRKFGFGDLAGLALIGLSVLFSMFTLTGAQTTNASSAVLNTVCNVFNTVKSVIFILGLTLMLLGAAIYSGANLMPSQSRGPFQGYGMSMIIGGVVGTAIAVVSPYILNTVVTAAGPNVTAALNNYSGNSGYTVVNGQSGVVQGAISNICSQAYLDQNNGGSNNNPFSNNPWNW